MSTTEDKDKNEDFTIQSVYKPTGDMEKDWDEMKHTHIPLRKGIKSLAIYRCSQPCLYDSIKKIAVPYFPGKEWK